MAKKDQTPSEPASESPTERESAPETVTAVAPRPQAPQAEAQPRQMQVERQGQGSSQSSRRFPQVRGGICEYCGVLDGSVPSQYQYKLCSHYRGMQLACTYCPEQKDADDVIYHADLNVAEHPDNPNKLVVWCNSYDCSRAHEARFKRAVT